MSSRIRVRLGWLINLAAAAFGAWTTSLAGDLALSYHLSYAVGLPVGITAGYLVGTGLHREILGGAL